MEIQSLQYHFSEGLTFCQGAGFEACHGGACPYPQLLRGMRKYDHEFQATLGNTVRHSHTNTTKLPLILLVVHGKLSKRAPAEHAQGPMLNI